jgi:hypothetical protein
MAIVPGSDFISVVEQLQAPREPLPIAMLPWLDCRYLTSATLGLILAELRHGCRPDAPIDDNNRHNRERAIAVIEAHFKLRAARDQNSHWVFSRG